MTAEEEPLSGVSSAIEPQNESISIQGLFNIFSIFFASTVALGFIFLLYSIPDVKNNPLFPSILAILISIFFIGYSVVTIVIFLFNLIRFSKFAMKIYRTHEKGFKISLLLIFLISISIIASIFAANNEFSIKIIGFTGLTIITIIIVALQNIILEFTAPYTKRLSDWICKNYKK